MWGVIPAAGRGSRMEEHHIDGCKELIEVGARSMLLRTVDELVAAGVSGIVVVTSPEKPAIAEALADFDAADLEFVEQSEPEGIVDALRKAREVVGDEMLVASPDNLFIGHPCPSAELLAAHASGAREELLHGSLATILGQNQRLHRYDDWSAMIAHWASLVDQELLAPPRSHRHELHVSQSLFGGGEIHGWLTPRR